MILTNNIVTSFLVQHDHIATTYGLHRNSILNSTRFFHIVDGLAPDIMHDILEGSLQYEVKELLRHFIQVDKYFTIDALNKIISEFPYVLSPDQQPLLLMF